MRPLLFTIVLEALYREFRYGLPWELLYADDLDLMAESEDKLMEKFELWRSGMEDKGLRVNMDKQRYWYVVLNLFNVGSQVANGRVVSKCSCQCRDVRQQGRECHCCFGIC